MKQFKKLVQSIAVAILMLSPLSIVALFNPSLASAGTNQCTWTGGGADDNWSTAANWVCSVGTLPTTGYDVILPQAQGGVWINHDVSSTNEYAGIWMTDNVSCAGSYYNIYNGGFQLGGDITYDDSNGCTNMELSITTGDITITSDSIFDIRGAFSITGQRTIPGGGVTPSTINLGTNQLDFIIANGNQPTLDTDLSGSGAMNINGGGSGGTLQINAIPSFDGLITVVNGDILAHTVTSLGSSAGSTTIGDLASLTLGGGNGTQGSKTISEDITFTGQNSPAGTKLSLSQPGSLFYPGGIPTSGELYFPGTNWSLTGDIDIQTSLEIAALNDVSLTGNLTGPTFEIISARGGGLITVSGATNTTATPNGAISKSVAPVTYSDLLPGSMIGIGSFADVTITGSRGDVYVFDGGILRGTGTVANIFTQGGILRPGLSPGVMNTGNLVFDSATVMDAELEGTGAGQYDKFNVTGTVSLGNATLNTILFNGYAPNLNDSFTIINNDGSDAVTGTFAGLAQGATVTVGTYQFTISYTGGTGNDVVLTSSYEPGPPGTGFAVFQNSLLIPAMLVVGGAGVLFYSNRKLAKVKSRR